MSDLPVPKRFELDEPPPFELSAIVLVIVLVLVLGLLALLVKRGFGVTKQGQGNKRILLGVKMSRTTTTKRQD